MVYEPAAEKNAFSEKKKKIGKTTFFYSLRCQFRETRKIMRRTRLTFLKFPVYVYLDRILCTDSKYWPINGEVTIFLSYDAFHWSVAFNYGSAHLDNGCVWKDQKIRKNRSKWVDCRRYQYVTHVNCIEGYFSVDDLNNKRGYIDIPSDMPGAALVSHNIIRHFIINNSVSDLSLQFGILLNVQNIHPYKEK